MDRRSELKRAYKESGTPAGVMCLRNTLNGKIFVTSGTNMDGLPGKHQLQLRLGSHPNKALQADWNTFGEEVFVFETLDLLEDPAKATREDLQTLESLWLDRLQPYGDRGYHKPK